MLIPGDNVDLSPPATPAPRVTAMRKFTCPSCGGEIQIRAGGHSLMAVCAHCSSVIDVADERIKVIDEVNARVARTFLEIGQRAAFKGVTWELIGYVRKSDKTKMYFWEEYLLFNPYHGFRFLVQMDGHWNFVTIVKRDITKVGFVCNVPEDEGDFQPFLEDNPIVQYVKGEFYWRVKKGDRAKTEDYVAPPYMLSLEYDSGDTTVSMCEYLEPEEVHQAFALDKDMPTRKGVGPNQPSPVNGGGVTRTAIIALLLLVVFHVLNIATAANKVVTTVQSTHVGGDQSKSFTTEPFEIPKRSNVLINSYAAVSNSWVELDVSLVNEQTKEIFEVQQAIEYYFGSDSDGPWSEGGTTSSDYMSSVPPGLYRLVYEIDADAFGAAQLNYLQSPLNGKSVNVTIQATRDVASWGNFFLTLLALLLCPIYVAMRSSAFETKRWENSDFPRGGE